MRQWSEIDESIASGGHWRIVGLVLFGAFLLSPFAILLGFAEAWRVPIDKQTLYVFSLTVLQAGLSALASMIFGVLGGLGLLWASRFWSLRAARTVEVFSLLPNVTPVLLLILAVMKFLPAPRGLLSIVLTHALLNSGLIAASFASLARERLSAMAELAWIEGVSARRFLFRVVLPVLRSEFATLFLFVFVLCFSSFAIPLMLGGSRATTFEVLIWQKIRIDGDWSAALGLSFLQIVTLLGLSAFLRRESHQSIGNRVSLSSRLASPLLTWKWGLVFAIGPSILVVFGLFTSFLDGAVRLWAIDGLRADLGRLLLGSIFVGMGTGLCSGAALLAVAFIHPQGSARRFLLGYVAPSSVLTGFALLMLSPATGFATFLKIIFGLTLIMTPSFYRLRWDGLLRGLEGQRVVAWSLGAGEKLIFARIVFPQVIRSACFLAGLASLWAWGDFALSSIVAERSMTIAMLVHALMESYRLDAATFAVWIMIIGGGLTFALFDGVGRVLGAQSRS